jgi:putative endopeptidase
MKLLPKLLVAFIVSVALHASLFAQTEPQKQPPIGSSPSPGNINRSSAEPPAGNQPPAASGTAASTDSASAPTEDLQNTKPVDAANNDTSVKPADDFFLYANGGWIKRTEIPPEYSRWGSFNQLIEQNNDALHTIAEKAASSASSQPGVSDVSKASPSDIQMVGDYFASGMDEQAVSTAGIAPLKDELGRIDTIKNKNDVLKEVAHLHTLGVGALFSFGSSPDDKDSMKVISHALQGGLGMPDRDYYTKTDEASKKLRDQYVDHVTKMLTLLGDPADKAGTEAKTILNFETKLAQASRTRVELRDPQKNYNKMTQAQLQKLTPDWKWADFFKEINLAAPGDVDVHQPDFFKAVDQAVKATSIDDWKTYLKWSLIDATASKLSDDFVNENFKFNETTLKGTPKIKPRWKRVVTTIDGEIGESLGKLYVADYFPPQAKARMVELIGNLKEALGNRIKTLEWMDEPTKKEALKKLAAFQVKVGYPDKWRDYSLLKIDRGPYVLNTLRAENFEVKRDLNKIGKAVDRTEWGMTPPTVNAYYNPTFNEIVFPAGILQPPFFYASADDAVNYGAIGAVIGHEMTHGFDDQGRQYDAQGNLRDWWTADSAKKFKERSGAIVKQYGEYEPLPGLHLNGELTQGENIADIGGLKIAYAAFKKATAGKPQEKIDGLTPDQRFFLSYASIWRQKIRDEDQKMRITVDPHSPGHFRVNGPLSNMPEFQKAFDIPDGSAMVRAGDKKVNIW